jgi:RES domain
MPFSSSDAYYQYERSVIHKLRYMHEESVREFLHAVQETSASRAQTLPSGKVLWRAQQGFTYRIENKGQPDEMEIECAFDPERMKPIPQKVKDGRVNPRGIAYLYLAADQNTACAEVRPWLKSYISLGQFRTNRRLHIVDCTSEEKKGSFKAFRADDASVIPWEPHEFESVVWGDVGYGMSRPITPEDSSLSYVPTQIIAESLRHEGFDGIAYRSLLTEGGVNIALFDIKDAELVACGLWETKAIHFTFEQCDNPYFVGRK